MAWADDETPIPDALTAYWDGPTLNLDWRGNTYTTASGTFVGRPVAVPGDQSKRTLKVRNDGPCAAILTVEVVESAVTVPNDSVNQSIADIIRLRWDISGTRGSDVFASIHASAPRTLAAVPVGAGQVVPVALGYEFPIDATGGKNGGFASTELSFGVRLTLRGDYCATQAPHSNPPSPTPTDDPGTGQPPGSTSSQPAGGQTGGGSSGGGRPGGGLSFTGSVVAGIVLPLAVILIMVGTVLFAFRRRRQLNGESNE
jgi:hypothetical protein